MRDRIGLIRFSASFAVLSTVLGWFFWSTTTTGSLGSYTFQNGMLAAPVLGAMLASVGFRWKRKLTYSAITVVLCVMSGAAAELLGLRALVMTDVSRAASFPSVASILYVSWLTTLPFVMLVLFVGRTPSLLWNPRVD